MIRLELDEKRRNSDYTTKRTNINCGDSEKWKICDASILMSRKTKGQFVIRDSLKGLSAAQYYSIVGMKNIIIATKKYLPENIWKKWDRNKPLSPRHKNMVDDAIQQVLYSKFGSQIPYSTPIFSKRRHGDLLAFQIYHLRKIITPNGTAYIAYGKKVTIDDMTGRVAFSTHAIDRIMTRTDLAEKAKKDIEKPLYVLMKSAAQQVVERGSQGHQLKMGEYGYCPLVWDQSIETWIATTFLENQMKGTAKHEAEQVRQGIQQLLDKFGS